MALFDTVDIIRVRRDGRVLTPDQIDWTVDAYTKGVIKDEQVAVLAMTILLRGMDRGKIAHWIDAMIHSDVRMDFSGIGKPTADKHSMGGVGDKITLPLASLVARFGVTVPQLPGQGLGYMDGTLSKLEAVPGWCAQLSNDEITAQLGQGCGAVIYAAGLGLAPADKRLYTLRDITLAVESIVLVASPIMSKKTAENTGALALGVEVGSDAFMKDLDTTRELARTMVDLGRDAGVAAHALLTDMSVPLGHRINNTLEVEESTEILAGGGSADAIELTCRLVRDMLDLVGVRNVDVKVTLADGRAIDHQYVMICEQGDDPDAPSPHAVHAYQMPIETNGTVVDMDTLSMGVASWCLSVGCAVKEDPVQTGTGIEIHAGPGECVVAGQSLLTLYTDDEWRVECALESLPGAIEVADGVAPESCSVILETIS